MALSSAAIYTAWCVRTLSRYMSARPRLRGPRYCFSAVEIPHGEQDQLRYSKLLIFVYLL
ncbi:hypothetical protein M404DRAFT_1007512 [Pisolithus tinctorius Marx 270]|uniref:Uncharacterized protein n=1 Tax=Pisolithus tinctorius Marx 270 TaxID=870435 RepID=A0A0C3IEC5_PISTI|nr:hypothetical protein M404DRAFT_1007512 [Pisolithus tinctorius Marx 270]